MAQRRASRVQARTQTFGCGGVVSQSNSLEHSPTPASDCGGTVSHQQYVPSVVGYEQQAQIGNLVLNGGVPLQEAQQRVLAPVCNGPNCIIGPTQSANPFPQFTPKDTSADTDDLFGLSAPADSFPTHILAQIATETTFGLDTTIPGHVLGQFTSDPVPPPMATAPIKTARDSFRTEILKATNNARKAGKITVREALKIRRASLSPAFMEQAHDLAITQMSFSGEASEFVQMNEDGVIQVEGINWEGLLKFLEAFIPLLLKLLGQFGL